VIRFNRHQPTADPNWRTRWSRAGLAIVVMVFVAPGFALAANWLAPASGQKVTAPWVKDIAVQLEQEPYRDVLASALAEPPHPAVVRYLNHAAQALQTGNKPLAQSYVDQTIGMFELGVLRGYYSRPDIKPIQKLIRERAEAAMRGEKVSMAQEQERWTGYTQRDVGGLLNSEAKPPMQRNHPSTKQ